MINFLFFRTKPVVNIEKTLTLSPNTIDFKAQDCKTSSWWDLSIISLSIYYFLHFYFLFLMHFANLLALLQLSPASRTLPNCLHTITNWVSPFLSLHNCMLQYQNNNECLRAIFMSHSRWVCLISYNITWQT